MLGVQKGVIFNTLDEIQGTLRCRKKEASYNHHSLDYVSKTNLLNYKDLKCITQIIDKKHTPYLKPMLKKYHKLLDDYCKQTGKNNY